MRRSQPCGKIEVEPEESILGRNNSISKGPGTGNASSGSVRGWEGCETSGKASEKLLLAAGPWCGGHDLVLAASVSRGHERPRTVPAFLPPSQLQGAAPPQ